MDLVREGYQFSFLWWTAVLIGWTLGGIFITRAFYRLEDGEEMLVGFGIGLTLYLFLCNLFARFLPAEVGFTLPAALILGAGLIAAARGDGLRMRFIIPRSQLWIPAVGIIAAGFFYLISRGVSLFDEYKNLTVIAQLARGVIPPTYVSDGPMAYHYGFQILPASLVAIGGFFPWSAFDLGKAITWGYAISLCLMVAGRYLSSAWRAVVVGFIFVFAGGTRYLLLLLPAPWLDHLDKSIDLAGTSSGMQSPLSMALRLPWTIDGGPPGSYLFGFMNGINPNFVVAHAGTGTLSIVIMLLIWLLLQRSRSYWSTPVTTILLAFWALTWESSFALFGLGVVGVGLYMLFWRRKDLRSYLFTVLLPSAAALLVATIQGGVITQWLARVFSEGSMAQSTGNPDAVNNTLGFYLRFPPAQPSAHLGSLEFSDPILILAILFELGLVILFLPWIVKRMRVGLCEKSDWVMGIFLMSTAAGFLIPLFIGFRSDRDITRFTGYSLTIWIILFGLVLLEQKKWSIPVILGMLTAVVISIGGVENMVRQWPAVTHPVNSYYINDQDVLTANDVFGKLAVRCKAYDPEGFRVLVLTGCVSDRYKPDTYHDRKEWLDLYDNPTLEGFLDQGYDYVYVDEKWPPIQELGTESFFKEECVERLTRYQSEDRFFTRRLFDLTACRTE